MQKFSLGRFVLVHALIAGMLSLVTPRLSHADPEPRPDRPPSIGYVKVVVSAITAQRLTTGTLTQAQFVALMNSALQSGSIVDIPDVDELIASGQHADGSFPAPVGPNGQPLPPPVKLPEVIPGVPNPWNQFPARNSDRSSRFPPIQSQTRASPVEVGTRSMDIGI